jgi:sortase B
VEEQVVKKEKQRRGRLGKQRNLISNIVLVLAVGVFLFSGYKLYTIFSEYHKGDKEYETIMDEVITKDSSEKKEENKTEEKEAFKVDFEKLQSINKEIVGWIRFDNPEKISYPIVQGKDNDKYLKKTVEGKTNGAGSIFMDAYNRADFLDKNTFIYGHNMKNGSMFGLLRKYKSFDFYKENPYFYIYTPDGREVKYQVYAVCIVEDTSESYNKFYENDDAYLKYLQYIKSIARYDTGVKVTAQTQLVSLSTCTNVTETQRLLVHGVKVEEPVAEGQVNETPVEEKAVE